MNLEGAYTVNEIIKSEIYFSIPIYQRLFVWEEQQISQLLNDLLDAFEKSKNSQDKDNNQSQDNNYYIGVITVKRSQDDKIMEIVDGQQRLTFLTLLGCELRWTDFVKGKGSKLRISYDGREDDCQDIQQMFEDISDLDKKNLNQKRKIQNANFLEFHRVFQKFEFELEKLNEGNVEGFSNYVKNNCAFLINELPNNYGPNELNLYFEKMNSTGRQLTPVECIKGKYFASYANQWNNCLNFDDAYKENKTVGKNSDTSNFLTNVKDIPDIAGKQEPSVQQPRFDRLVLRPEILLLHVLALTVVDYEKEKNQGVNLFEEPIVQSREKIIDTFNNVIQKFNDNDKNFFLGLFMDNLKKYRAWIDDNIIFLKNNNGEYEYEFRTNNEEGSNENNGGGLTKNGSDGANQISEMKQFQSMLYVSSSDWQEWVLEAYKECNKGTSGKNVTLDLLKKQDRNRHADLKEESFTYNNVDRYWFWRLDYILWENFKNKKSPSGKQDDSSKVNYKEEYLRAINNYTFKRNRSIEHLHPQTDTNSQFQKSWENEINMFGNLAMISSSFNSTQGNGTVGIKFQHLKEMQIEKNKLESIKLLVMFVEANEQESGWTPDKAKEHGEAMLDLLKEEMIPKTASNNVSETESK